jgi:PAS domain S-box-containing protein
MKASLPNHVLLMMICLVIGLALYACFNVAAIPTQASTPISAVTTPAAAEQETKRVFVLNSFNRGYTWTDNMLRGIDDAFGSSGIKVETYVTFMDMKRIPPTPQYFLQLKGLIQDGYKGVRFDAILACDNDALEFIRDYRDELFPGVPVVFSSINDFEKGMLDGRNDITGTSENTDYEGTLRLALKLRPSTKNIVVVIDATTTGKAHRSAVEKISPDFPDITFTYLSLADMTLEELEQKLSQLSSDSIVLLLQHFVDKNGSTYSVQESTPLLTQSSSVPVFVLADIRVGLGALGGHVVSGYHHGYAAAQMVVQILRGTDVRTIPVLLDSPNQYMFDYRVMQRFNIAEGNLPPGSIVLNQPVSIFNQYHHEIYAILGAFVILCAILIFLLFEIRRRRKIEAALRENQMMLTHIFDSVPQSIFWKDRSGVYLGCNENFARTVELAHATQIVGKTDYDLPWSHAEAEAYRADDQEVIGQNQPKRHIIEPGRTADGTPIWADTTKVPLTDATGNPYGVLGVYEDISERRRVEEALKASERIFSTIFSATPAMMAIANLADNRLLKVNPSFLEAMGLSEAETIGQTSEALGLLATPAERTHRLAELRENSSIKSFEMQLRRKDGCLLTVVASSEIITLDNQPCLLTSALDITERKQANEQIRAALVEKETLLRELYHRTKNNMNVIIAMLSLQAAHTQDSTVETIFRETENRIQAMSLVHQMLYQAQDLSHVNMRQYVEALISRILQGYSLAVSRVALELDIEEINVLIDIAIPCGLILNELVINALKYAFPANRKGTLKIQLSRIDPQTLELIFSDNGVGVSPEFDFRAQETLGFQTIIALTEHQLQGQASFENTGGITWRLRFTDTLYTARV